jgi:hypothetical protein
MERKNFSEIRNEKLKMIDFGILEKILNNKDLFDELWSDIAKLFTDLQIDYFDGQTLFNVTETWNRDFAYTFSNPGVAMAIIQKAVEFGYVVVGEKAPKGPKFNYPLYKLVNKREKNVHRTKNK